MSHEITITPGITYRIVSDEIRPFMVCVPHQRKPFLARIEEMSDDEIDGLEDLSCVYHINSTGDALPLLEYLERDGQARHQAIGISCLLQEELTQQGALEQVEDTTETDDDE